MKLSLHCIINQSRTLDHANLYRLDLTDSPEPLLARVLKLPTHDLTTHAPTPIAEPLRLGLSRLHHAQHCEATTQATLNTFKAMGAGLVAVAILTGSCMAVAPLIGSTALVINGMGSAAIVVAFAGVALRERVISEAMRANYLLADAFDEMDSGPNDEDMAIEFARRAIKALNGAHRLGVIDQRIYPAVRQFAQAYNAKFAAAFDSP